MDWIVNALAVIGAFSVFALIGFVAMVIRSTRW